MPLKLISLRVPVEQEATEHKMPYPLFQAAFPGDTASCCPKKTQICEGKETRLTARNIDLKLKVRLTRLAHRVLPGRASVSTDSSKAIASFASTTREAAKSMAASCLSRLTRCSTNRGDGRKGAVRWRRHPSYTLLVLPMLLHIPVVRAALVPKFFFFGWTNYRVIFVTSFFSLYLFVFFCIRKTLGRLWKARA